VTSKSLKRYPKRSIDRNVHL